MQSNSLGQSEPGSIHLPVKRAATQMEVRRKQEERDTKEVLVAINTTSHNTDAITGTPSGNIFKEATRKTEESEDYERDEQSKIRILKFFEVYRTLSLITPKKGETCHPIIPESV